MPDVKTGPTSGSKTEAAALSLVDVCIVILTVLGGGLGLATAVLFVESLMKGNIKKCRECKNLISNSCRLLSR